MYDHNDINVIKPNLLATNINDGIVIRKEDLFKAPEFKLYSPSVLLNGHKGDIYTGKFSREGFLFASAGYDRDIQLWEVFDEKCRNITTLNGHTNAVLELTWSQDDSKVFTCSADKTVSVWDVYEAKRIKKFKGHESFVNCLDATKKGSEMIISAGDDCQLIQWDLRSKHESFRYKFKYQITAIAYNLANDQVFIGGIDNQIKVFDLRKQQVDNCLIGHTDTITGLALSNDGNYLLSNSMDHTIKCWDIRPYVQGLRCIKNFTGVSHNFEKNLLRVCWSSDDSLISAGSSDRIVYVWNFNTGKIEYKFGGHNGSVNETSFNKLSNILSSVSSDQTIILGEY